MAGFRYLTLVALAALASGQSIDSLDPCGRECYTKALNNAGTYNCAAMDMNCLCRVQNWAFAVRDCAKNVCPPGYEATVTNAVNALCATATLPAGVPVSTSHTTTGPAPTTTQPPTSISSTSSTSSSSSQTTPSTTSASSSTTVETSTTSAAASTLVTTSAVAPTKVVAGSTSASADSAASTSEAPADNGATSGLTEAAKIGIGVGVSAAVIGLLTVAACVFLRRRRAKTTAPTAMDRYKISGPMPSNEHAYTHNNNSEYDIGSSELEMKSRRYEEMTTGEQPRQMV